MTEKVFEKLLEEAVCKMAQEEEQSYPPGVNCRRDTDYQIVFIKGWNN